MGFRQKGLKIVSFSNVQTIRIITGQSLFLEHSVYHDKESCKLLRESVQYFRSYLCYELKKGRNGFSPKRALKLYHFQMCKLYELSLVNLYF